MTSRIWTALAGISLAVAAQAQGDGGGARGPSTTGGVETERRAAQDATVKGTIEQTKQVRVPGGAPHEIALVRSRDGAHIVDLGPRSQLGPVRLEAGSRIEATGQYRRVGDRAVLIASRVSQDEQTVRLDRSELDGAPRRASAQERVRVSGTVVRKLEVTAPGGTKHTVVLLRRPEGDITADLGPAGGQKVDFGQQLTVDGRLVRIGDRIVVWTGEGALPAYAYALPAGARQGSAHAPGASEGGEAPLVKRGPEIKAHGSDQVISGRIGELSGDAVRIDAPGGVSRRLHIAPQTMIDGELGNVGALREGQQVRASFNQAADEDVAVEIRPERPAGSSGPPPAKQRQNGRLR